jgi:hypothetical protein
MIDKDTFRVSFLKAAKLIRPFRAQEMEAFPNVKRTSALTLTFCYMTGAAT